MQDMRSTNTHLSPVALRRIYPSEIKAQILLQSHMSAASVATTALQHRLNPVSVHRWMLEAKQKQLSNDAASLPLRLDLGAGIDAIMLATVGPDPFDLQACQSAAQSELPTAQFIDMHEVDTSHVAAERL